MRLLLDEQLDRALAEQLRARGHDVIAVTEDPALRGMGDAALLDWAADEDRGIATCDIRDFLPLVEERQSVGRRFAGVILISVRRFPPGDRGHGRLLRALRAVLEANRSRTSFVGKVVWL